VERTAAPLQGPAARLRAVGAEGSCVYAGAVTTLEIERAGLVGYEEAWARQRELHERRVSGAGPDTLLLLEHPSVYTAGRRTEAHERPVDGTPVIDVDRGGKITWHGPGQLVGYPIIALPDPIDVVAYVGRLEEALIEVCAGFGLTTGRVEGRSGVWVAADAPGTGFRPERKVAAIGVRVARGVTMHGFALNCDPDLGAFGAIVPCGIPDAGVTSLSAELGRDITVADAIAPVEAAMTRVLAFEPAPAG
jgi:lipoyl(octanoyl) transferase